MFKKYSIAAGAALAVGLAGVATPVVAKVEGDFIILGSAISLSGKYSTNGLHTQRGYDFAVDRINEKGGVKVGDKSYKLIRILKAAVFPQTPVYDISYIV